MGKFNLEKIKSAESEIKNNIEDKKIENAKLDESKELVMQAGFEIQDSDLSDEVSGKLMEYINEELLEIKQQGKDLAKELDGDWKKLLELQTEVSENQETNQEERNKLENKKDILDKFGLGRTLEKPIEELNRNEMTLSEASESLKNTQDELMSVIHELDNK